MPHDKQYNFQDSDDTEGDGSIGGQGGHIEFVDFITTKESKTFTQAEINVFKAEHNRINKVNIEKQQKLREARAQFKNEGKKAQFANSMGGLGSGQNQYKTHPLSQEAQFSGDRQNMQVPGIFEAQTEEKQQDELQNQYQKQHELKMSPRPSFHPKPQFSK